MSLSKLSFRAILVLACMSFFAVCAGAQFKASIQGTILDPKGGVVGGAKVTVANQDTGVSHDTVSSDQGFYRVTELPPGSYTLTVEAAGFQKKEIKNIAVNAEQIRGVDVTLEVGQVTATITVSGDTLTDLQSEDANVSGTITNQQVNNLPSFGRDPYQL